MIKHDAESRETFLNTLDWLILVVERYKENFNFALVKIAYGNANELGETYGAPEASKQLVAMTADLQKAFRRTDLVARNGSDFWVIFPYTPFSENIYEKIVTVMEDAHHAGLNVVDREIAIFTSPFDTSLLQNAQPTAIELLDYLKTHQNQFASHVFRFLAN
jgi:GGDEF domain-containing protein